MTRQYPIWNEVQACAYKSAKSYGGRQTSSVKVMVGSSSSNSHHFVDHAVTHRLLDNGARSFRFLVDGVVIKEGLLPKGSSHLVTTLNVDLLEH